MTPWHGRRQSLDVERLRWRIFGELAFDAPDLCRGLGDGRDIDEKPNNGMSSLVLLRGVGTIVEGASGGG